jgi:drug/metabolite transporter (DMT)-like permease
MKQQAGIGIILALTTAMCWGALPIAMKQVLEVMAPPTVVFYRFLMASIGLGDQRQTAADANFSQAALAGVISDCHRRSVR